MTAEQAYVALDVSLGLWPWRRPMSADMQGALLQNMRNAGASESLLGQITQELDFYDGLQLRTAWHDG